MFCDDVRMRQPPTTPPRHLQHSASSHRGGLLPGRAASRLRALARSDALPRERALADATVLTAWLTAAQRARYAPGLRAGDDLDAFVQGLAAERRVVIEEGAEVVEDEIVSAADAEHAARRIPLRILEGLLLAVSAVGVLSLVWLGMGLGGEGWAGATRPLLAWAAVTVAALLLAALVGTVATRRRDRALLDWACARPGQLGRGIPVRRPLQRLSPAPTILAVLGPTLLIGAALLAVVIGAAILLVTLLSRENPGLVEVALGCFGGGVAAFIVAMALSRLRTRRLELLVRRAAAVEWLGKALDPAQVTPAGRDGDSPAP